MNVSGTANGCSLENCHTNLFALTDLKAIKWKKWCADGSHPDPLSDPILRAYARCTQADMLCVWRRTSKSQSDKYTDLLSSKKELWVFWYGDEPANLTTLLSPELKDVENGSFEIYMSYECRTLLFKALHNLIERCLVSHGYVRVGRWFVQPFENSMYQYRSRRLHLSFQFSFFLHGESNVCASIDVRQHPPLYRLGVSQLAQATRQSSAEVPVILAPYGLRAYLVGARSRETEQVKRMLDEWYQFYAMKGLDVESEEDGSQRLPAIVEVTVGGVRMRYPTGLVLIEGDSSSGLCAPHRTLGSSADSADAVAASGPSEKAAAADSDKMGSASVVMNAMRHVQRALEDSATSSMTPPAGVSSGCEYTDVPGSNMWLFSDNTKSLCACGRGKQKDKSAAIASSRTVVPPTQGKHSKSDKPGGERAEKSSVASRSLFHKRATDDKNCAVLSLPRIGSDGRATASQKTGVGNIASTGHQQQDASLAASKDSPNLGAPSPLADAQMSFGGNADPMMPTLSPQPPSSKCHEKENCDLTSSATASELQQLNIKLNSESASVSGVASGLCVSASTTVPTRTSLGSLSLLLSTPAAPVTTAVVPTANKLSPVKAAIRVPVHAVDMANLKRPQLAAASYEDDDSDSMVLSAIYDFDSTGHSAKRGRLDDSSHDPSSAVGADSCRSGDPYEFSDDGVHASRGSLVEPDLFSPGTSRDGAHRRSAEAQRTGAKTAQGQAGVNASLIKEEDLKPTIHDLDNLFASDSDASDSDMPPTPPKSNRPDKNRGQTVLGVTLSQVDIIYPTPPSMEPHVNDQSPHQRSDPLDIGDDHFEDTVSVFKPPQVAAYVMPSSYKARQLVSATGKNALPATFTYQPSFHFMNFQHASRNPVLTSVNSSHQPMDTSTSVLQSNSNSRNVIPTTEVSASAAIGGSANSHLAQLVRTPRTPLTELQSPASNASSYLNRTLSSVDNQPTTNSQRPEVNSLVTNIFLSDSVLNLFKDSNFDSCPMCVCNGNILGADNGVYLPDRSKEDQFKCSCGFSAVVNRKYGVNSGLFYEDEFDITGKRALQAAKKPSLFALAGNSWDTSKGVPPPEIPESLLLQLQTQFSCLIPTAIIDYAYIDNKQLLAAGRSNSSGSDTIDEINMLEMKDGCEACWLALEAGLQATDGQALRLDELKGTIPLHKWPYLQGASTRLVASSAEVVRLLKSLQPLLQDALQKKRSTRLWDAVYKVDGPLNWKDFHRLAGRGLEETSKPQPIPRLMFGMERDWVSMSPFVLRHWDRFLLEPYGDRRNVLYVVVAPDSDSVLTRLITFFKDLSTVYETSHLGRHGPLSTKLRDGILRVGTRTAAKVASDPVDPWFTAIGNHHLASRLKTYAQICRHHLGPFVAQEMSSHSAEALSKQQQPPVAVIRQEASLHSDPLQNSLMPGGGHSQLSQGSLSLSQDDKSLPGDVLREMSSVKDQTADAEMEESSREQPSVVVYIIDPFGFGNESSPHSRLATFGLLQCFNEFVSSLPEALQLGVHLQVLPLQLIYQHELCPDMNYLKNMALSVYTQACRVLSAPTSASRCLTLSSASTSVESVSEVAKTTTVCLMCPPYVLASERDTYFAVSDMMADRSDQSAVLFCTYCLSADQQWLLAACTDHRGELLDTVTINIDVPNAHLRKKASARRVGLRRLWEFVMGVVSKTTTMWRVVIGRFGRLGHGELKGWSGLLSRKNLQRSSHVLHAMCTACKQSSGSARGQQRSGRATDVTCGVCGLAIGPEVPYIVSACLVSLELHPTIHVMTDSVNNGDAFGLTAEEVSTPRDASCTHILVFPTSATAQAQASNDQRGPVDSADLGDESFLPTFEEEDLGDLGGDFHDIFGGMYADENDKQQGRLSPGASGMHGSSLTSAAGGASGNGLDAAQDEMGNLSQQPLAVGYYVSTAKTGTLPRWFWSSCPHKENTCPTCFRAALHIHSTLVHADDAIVHPSVAAQAHSHPLDSHLTCDVLRYVLETYNALSWLTIDTVTNERRSCLPPHVVVLMQLYHAMEKFV